jgi:hypothetical protein
MGHKYPKRVNLQEKLRVRGKHGQLQHIDRYVPHPDGYGKLVDRMNSRVVFPLGYSVDSVVEKKGTGLKYLSPAEAAMTRDVVHSDTLDIVNP